MNGAECAGSRGSYHVTYPTRAGGRVCFARVDCGPTFSRRQMANVKATLEVNTASLVSRRTASPGWGRVWDGCSGSDEKDGC